MCLFRDAFTIYVAGYARAKSLLRELKQQSKQFRLFLDETECDGLRLSTLLDLPLRHIQRTLGIFMQMRRVSVEVAANDELTHIDSLCGTLRGILAHVDTSTLETLDDDEVTRSLAFSISSCSSSTSSFSSTVHFMAATINNSMLTENRSKCASTCASSRASSSSSCYSSADDDDTMLPICRDSSA